jgi:hypothetical protein
MVDAMIRQMLKLIVIRMPIRGAKRYALQGPTPGWPIGRLGVGHPQGVFVVF